MKHLNRISVILLAALLMLGCQASLTEQSIQSGVQSQEEAIITENALEMGEADSTDSYREPNDEELNEFGIIKGIEDGVYPMYQVTVEFPERQTKETFDLNMEAISMDMNELMNLPGKYVTLYYIAELAPSLYDVHHKGKTLLGEYAPEYDDSMKQITGILNGAAAETYSDLPGKISVTDDEGNKIEFEYYVDDLMVPANGQVVTAFYYMQGRQTITYLKASED